MSDLRTIALEELAKAQQAVERWKAILAELDPDETATDDETVTNDERDFARTITAKEAAHRFSVDETTVRRWCRDEGIGKRRGDGQWDVSIRRLQRRLNTINQVD